MLLFDEEVCVAELMFLETSALTGENVEDTFLQCARSILTKIESGMTAFTENFCDDNLHTHTFADMYLLGAKNCLTNLRRGLEGMG